MNGSDDACVNAGVGVDEYSDFLAQMVRSVGAALTALARHHDLNGSVRDLEQTRPALHQLGLAAVDALTPFVRDVLDSFELELVEGWNYLTVSRELVVAVMATFVAPIDDRRLLCFVGPHDRLQMWTPLGLQLLRLLASTARPVADAGGADPRLWFGNETSTLSP